MQRTDDKKSSTVKAVAKISQALARLSARGVDPDQFLQRLIDDPVFRDKVVHEFKEHDQATRTAKNIDDTLLLELLRATSLQEEMMFDEESAVAFSKKFGTFDELCAFCGFKDRQRKMALVTGLVNGLLDGQKRSHTEAAKETESTRTYVDQACVQISQRICRAYITWYRKAYLVENKDKALLASIEHIGIYDQTLRKLRAKGIATIGEFVSLTWHEHLNLEILRLGEMDAARRALRHLGLDFKQ